MYTIINIISRFSIFKPFSFLILLLLPFLLFSQEKYLLTTNEMPGYELVRQSTDYWAIKGIEQRWKKLDAGSDPYPDVFIRYGEFNNESHAITSVAYTSGSFSGIFVFGSLTGEIIGNATWSAIDGPCIYFQKWNVGISIRKSIYLTPYNKNIILDLSNKILAKINANIPVEYVSKDIELQKHQIPIIDYNKITKASNDIFISKGFSEFKVENSKWILRNDSLVMGLRKQWSKGKSFFSIDVTKYSNAIDAQTALKKRSEITRSPLCLLTESESVNKAIELCSSLWAHTDTMKYISIIGQIGEYAIHFYYFNEKGVDVELFKRAVLAINSDGTGITDLENTGIRIYPNPAHEMFTLEINDRSVTNCELFNSNGQLIKTLPVKQGANNYTIRDLKEGLYLIKIKSEEGTMVKKIIKN